MEPPNTGAYLQQFFCALQWVKQAIPTFTKLIVPLHGFMKRVYDHAKKRAKRAVSCILLSAEGWSEMEQLPFNTCKKALSQQITLSHRDLSQWLYVFTEASDTAWFGIITQIPS